MTQEQVESAVRRVREAKALGRLVGEAPNFTKVAATIPLVARHDGAVLVTGETGTGKELVARAVHYSSGRAGFPFVCVNCASFPDLLIEDTLFGHEAGAYTDARAPRRGLFAEASGGTLFLDEVEALSPRAQAALLRVLQDGTFYTLGSARQQRSSARVIAATNAPLDQMVASGAFRSDLYHRLRVFFIDLPPLREREGDILLLARYFLDEHTPPGKGPLDLDEHARLALVGYAWPGNVRELENAILRAAVGCRGGLVTIEDLGISAAAAGAVLPPAAGGSYQALKREAIAAFERGYLSDLMARHQGNVTHAARTAGKERRELGKLLKKYAIDPREYRAS